jgi:hypothetical protein
MQYWRGAVGSVWITPTCRTARRGVRRRSDTGGGAEPWSNVRMCVVQCGKRPPSGGPGSLSPSSRSCSDNPARNLYGQFLSARLKRRYFTMWYGAHNPSGWRRFVSLRFVRRFTDGFLTRPFWPRHPVNAGAFCSSSFRFFGDPFRSAPSPRTWFTPRVLKITKISDIDRSFRKPRGNLK